MTSRGRSRIPLAVSLLGLILSALPAFAATVTFRVPDIEGRVGGTVDVPITAVAAPGLSAVHLEMTYDPRIVTPDTVSRGALAGTNSLVDFNGSNPGRLLVGVATLDAIKGDGPLAIARFKVIGEAGTNTVLTLDSCRAWETGAHAEVLVKTEAGRVTIAGGGFPWWILLVAAVCLAVLAMVVVLLIVLGRRRKASPSSGAHSQPVPAPAAQSVDAFRRAEDQYFGLKGRLAAGRMTQEQFEVAMRDLMVQDAQGRYWTIDMHTGRWLVHDGQAWIERQPQ